MISRIALGTAQFVLDYGINNKRGKIPRHEVFEILKCAWKNNIRLLDTAYAYGASERVIGQFIKNTKFPLRVVSKLPRCNSGRAENIFLASLKRLNQDKLYGYLIHDFRSFLRNNSIWKVLGKFKAEGKIKKIGFSLYYPSQLEFLFKKIVHFDIVQVPYNFFDQRFNEYFPLLKQKKIEVHVRSLFLQGLIFKDPHKLKGKFLKLKDGLDFLRTLSEENNIPLAAIAINFALLNKGIDRVVIGVESLKNLEENINNRDYIKIVKRLYPLLLSLAENDENIILPINWA